MEIRKLAYMPYAQAKVIITDTEIVLISYTTTVCIIDNEGWLTCTGTYSPTTRRHIGAFMKEYVQYPNGSRGTYQEAKACYQNGHQFNIYTGEIR